MQMCPDCGRVYDESEYTRCPYCNKVAFRPKLINTIAYWNSGKTVRKCIKKK